MSLVIKLSLLFIDYYVNNDVIHLFQLLIDSIYQLDMLIFLIRAFFKLKTVQF